MAGTKNSGRRSMTDGKIQQFKGIAWDLVIKRCTLKDKKQREEWIDKYTNMFANKMMPQEISGGAEPIKVVTLSEEKYAAIIARESKRVIAGAISDSEDGGEKPVS